MNKIFLMLFVVASVISCKKENHEVHKMHKMSPSNDLKGVKVINEEDPICHMKTAEFLKDTAIYKGETYGFCSDFCKKEFKKDPEKYADQ